MTATTAPSPRGITGQIARVSARFFDRQETQEWTLLDNGTAGEAAGGRLFTGQIQVPDDLDSGEHRIRVQLEDDQARTYPHDVSFRIYPAEDLLLFSDALTSQWRETNGTRGVELDAQESHVVYRGASALAFRNIGEFFRVFFEPVNLAGVVGFTSLRFAFHPGDSTAFTEFAVIINGEMVYLFGDWGGNGVDTLTREWQLVDIPLDFVNSDTITSIGFMGGD